MSQLVAPGWHPMLPYPPRDPSAWHFLAPPGWHVDTRRWRPTAAWRPDPTWPPAPAGWVFWVEKWHGYLCLGSVLLAGGGVAAIVGGVANNLPGLAVLGLFIIPAVIVAGVFSSGWRRVALLSGGRKAFVWAVALPGITYGLCFILTFVLMDKMFNFYNRYLR